MHPLAGARGSISGVARGSRPVKSSGQPSGFSVAHFLGQETHATQRMALSIRRNSSTQTAIASSVRPGTTSRIGSIVLGSTIET